MFKISKMSRDKHAIWSATSVQWLKGVYSIAYVIVQYLVNFQTFRKIIVLVLWLLIHFNENVPLVFKHCFPLFTDIVSGLLAPIIVSGLLVVAAIHVISGHLFTYFYRSRKCQQSCTQVHRHSSSCTKYPHSNDHMSHYPPNIHSLLQ